MEDLTVARWEEVRGEDDKGVGPHEDGMFHTPPLVIVEVVLFCVCVCACACVS